VPIVHLGHTRPVVGGGFLTLQVCIASLQVFLRSVHVTVQLGHTRPVPTVQFRQARPVVVSILHVDLVLLRVATLEVQFQGVHVQLGQTQPVQMVHLHQTRPVVVPVL
jgi:hypothetical protein